MGTTPSKPQESRLDSLKQSFKRTTAYSYSPPVSPTNTQLLKSFSLSRRQKPPLSPCSPGPASNHDAVQKSILLHADTKLSAPTSLQKHINLNHPPMLNLPRKSLPSDSIPRKSISDAISISSTVSLSNPIVDSLKDSYNSQFPNKRGSLASRRSSNASRFSRNRSSVSLSLDLDCIRTPSLQPTRLDISTPAYIPEYSPTTKPGASLTASAADLYPRKVPIWLRKIIELNENERAKHITSLYRQIEITEKIRLSNPSSPPLSHSSSSSSLESLWQFDSSSLESVSSIPPKYSFKTAYSFENKNRYHDIVPFEYNRVMLEDDEYINASYMGGFPGCKTYIATQAPLHSTISDFWKMVWERKSAVVVMLTPLEEHGRIKSVKYWPDKIGHVVNYGSINVHLVDEERIPTELTITLREFKVVRNHEKRKIMHIHFEGWEDRKDGNVRSVLTAIDLANSLIRRSVLAVRQHLYISRFDEDDDNGETDVPQPPPTPDLLASPLIGPMVVHCSAGCGRTGTFIAIDTCLTVLDRLLSSDTNDADVSVVFEESNGRVVVDEFMTPVNNVAVKKYLKGIQDKDLVEMVVGLLRDQRIASVQTLEQYAFCYEVLVTRLSEWNAGGRKLAWEDGMETPRAGTPTTPTMKRNKIAPMIDIRIKGADSVPETPMENKRFEFPIPPFDTEKLKKKMVRSKSPTGIDTMTSSITVTQIAEVEQITEQFGGLKLRLEGKRRMKPMEIVTKIKHESYSSTITSGNTIANDEFEERIRDSIVSVNEKQADTIDTPVSDEKRGVENRESVSSVETIGDFEKEGSPVMLRKGLWEEEEGEEKKVET